MSVLVKARPGGANYIYSVLMGYEEKPVDLILEEAGYGVAGTTRDSAATQRKTDTTFNQASLQQKRDTTLNNKNMRAGNRPERNVAGANKTSTGSRTSTDPDDQQRSSNSQQSAQNSAEINRLKQLLSRR